MYECVICLELNHASRLHCKNCGTIPSQYSITGKPGSSQLEGVEVVKAFGAVRSCEHQSRRLGLKTQSLTYYGE